MRNLEAGPVGKNTAMLVAVLALAGCSGKDSAGIKRCEADYSGPAIISAGEAVRAFSAEAALIKERVQDNIAAPDNSKPLLEAYDQIYRWADWSDQSVNTVDQASKILCIERLPDGDSQLVLNDHAESIRGLLQAAGIEFDLSRLIERGA